jgi:hypothetical protein
VGAGGEAKETSGFRLSPSPLGDVLPARPAVVFIAMKPTQLLGMAFVLGLLLAAAGCVGGQNLPAASATLHWATVDLPRASYCWAAGGRGECADSAGTDQLLESGYIKPYRTAGGFDVKITFHSASQPRSFNVELVKSPDGQLATVRESASHTFGVGMSPPAPAGLYVYVVTGTWAEGSVGFFLAIELLSGAA